MSVASSGARRNTDLAEHLHLLVGWALHVEPPRVDVAVVVYARPAPWRTDSNARISAGKVAAGLGTEVLIPQLRRRMIRW